MAGMSVTLGGTFAPSLRAALRDKPAHATRRVEARAAPVGAEDNEPQLVGDPQRLGSAMNITAPISGPQQKAGSAEDHDHDQVDALSSSKDSGSGGAQERHL